MKKYVKSAQGLNLNKHLSAKASLTGNAYQVILSGNAEDNTLKLRIGRATSTGRKTYAYAIVGQRFPGFVEIWYDGSKQAGEAFGAYKPNTFSDPQEYVDELVQFSVDILDEVNESLE